MKNPAAAPMHYRLALVAAAAFTSLHAVTLPMLMTYDGAGYVDLAMAFGARFGELWDFARTPLYPLALRVAFWALGRNAWAATVPNLALGFGATWLLAAAVRRAGSPRAASVCLVLLTIHPTLVTYEHVLLTETGTLFHLALIVNLLTWQPERPCLKTAALVLAVTTGFYFRPTLLALAPLVALLHGLGLSRADRSPKLRLLLPHVVAAVLLPFVAAYPWTHALEGSNRREYNREQLLYGLLKQAVLPPGDPLVSGQSGAYVRAIDGATVEGGLDPGGLTRAAHFPLYLAVAHHSPEANSIFFRSVTRYPIRYLSGVARGLTLYAGRTGIDSETSEYVRGVVLEASTGAKLWLPEDRLTSDITARFKQTTSQSSLSRAEGALVGPYGVVTVLGFLASLCSLALGSWRRDVLLLSLAAVPLFWVLLHAVTLMSSDRLVMPAQVVFVAGLVAFAAAIGRRPRLPTRPQPRDSGRLHRP